MDCNGFKQWLLSRDDRTARQAREHRAACPGCGRLYRSDEDLERTLAAGMQGPIPAAGLARRARAVAEAAGAPAARRWPAWLHTGMVPAFAAALAIVFMVWNPFANPLASLDAIGRYALDNHMQTNMRMAFRAEDTPDPQAWFLKRLDFRIVMPDFSRQGYTFLGGRECTIGPQKAAYLFYDANGQPLSVFVIPAAAVKMPLQADRRYRVDAPDHRLELWQQQGMVCITVRDHDPAVPSAT
jgi:anti-sigma factor RsiW